MGVTESKMSTVVRPNFATKGTDNITDINELEGLLSPFQREKLTYFFKQFFDCLLEQVLAERNKEGLEDRTWAEALAPSKVVVDSVSLSSWLHMWAKMCKGSAGIDDFPIWVQLIPRVIFNV